MVPSERSAGDFQLDPESNFYKGVLQALDASGVPVLVGGAYALAVYTGIARDTKDFDLFLRRNDLDAALVNQQLHAELAGLIDLTWLEAA